MMKRLFIFLIVLLSLSAPVLAQELTPDPASYLPADVPVYIQIDLSADGQAQFAAIASAARGMIGVPTAYATGADALDAFVTTWLPALNVADVLPWVGARAGLAFTKDADGNISQFVYVLPVADRGAAQAFIDNAVGSSSDRETVGGVPVIHGDSFTVADGGDVLWLGTSAGIDTVFHAPPLNLAQSAAYQRALAALPANAALTGYVNASVLADALDQYQRGLPPDAPSFATLAEAALRLHPAQSAMEDALLQSPHLNGIGFAVQSSGDQINLTAALSLDAQYPAPTLTTATAGTALLSLIPGDSFAVLDSYDVSTAALPLAGYAYLGISTAQYFTVIESRNSLGTPDPTPTPTPSPTPPPPPTADALIAQVQPIITQVTSLLGLSLDELYSLTNGEYAIAVFPGAGPTIGAALYLQSSDPQRLIDALDHVSTLILSDPTTGTPLVGIEHQSISGVDVALLGVPGVGERPAVGILNGNVLFVTMESTVSKVIASAQSQTPATPALNWRDAFGAGQDALLYLDPRMVDLYTLRQQRIPPLPATAIAGSLDMRDNGLFVLRLTATVGN